MTTEAATADRVLVVKLGAFGDLVLADGALQDIRAHHRGARIDLLTRKPFAALMRDCPWVDEVRIDANAPRWRVPAMLAWRRDFLAAGYTHVYDLQNSRRTAFYRRWLGGDGERRGLVRWSADARDAARSVDVPGRHARQLARAGIDATHASTPCPRWMAADASSLLAGAGFDPAGATTPFALLLPGSSARNAEKRWPHFAALSHALAAAGLGVITVPGPEEADLGEGYAGCVLRDGARAVDLRRLAGIAGVARCVIGNDSGPLHLASSLGAPSLVLLDGRNPSFHAAGERAGLRRLSATPLSALSLETVRDAALAACAERGLILS